MLPPARAFGTLLLAACTLAPATPSIERVDPAWGYNGEATAVAIEGENLFPTVIVAGTPGEGGRIEGTFQAWLESGDTRVALDGVHHDSYTSLSGEVPAGLDPGVYDLRVQVPTGLTTVLPDAFTVTDTRADHLGLSVSTAAYTVGDYARVDIRLLDPADQQVALPLAVRVTATSDSGVDGVSFYDPALDGQTPLRVGVGVEGQLDADGSGFVLVTSAEANDVTLTVEPVDDPVVESASQLLSWDAGPVDHVELALPHANFVATAGDDFDLTVRLLDAFDNVIEGESATIFVVDDCDGWFQPSVTIVGEGTTAVTLSTACEEDRIRTYAYGEVWETEAFQVRPGPVDAYSLAAAPSTVAAGDTLLVLARAVDAYDNVVTDHTADLVLHDDLGGLDLARGVGTQSCPGFTDGEQVCTASLWTAGPAVTLTGQDADGIRGDANAIEVVPGDPTTLVVTASDTSVEAGQIFGVTVRLLDDYGNSVGFDPGGTDAVAFDDASGTIACEWTGAVDGAQGFSCTIEGAVDDAAITARVRDLVGVEADPLVVVNGPLSSVELEPDGSTFDAGTAFTLDLRGFDAYGNPYLVQTDPVVDLTDTAGTFVPTSAVLGPLGTAQVSAVVVGAGPAQRIYASQGGAALGESRPFVVLPAGLDRFEIETPPWVDQSEAAEGTVSAVDVYGNTVTSYSGTVDLESTGGACASVEITTFEEGVADVALDCPTPTLAETLTATDAAGVTGTSDPFDVVNLYCSDGPSAALALEGDTDAILCFAEGDLVTVDADTSGSVAGGAPIAVRHFVDGEATVERTVSASTTLSYDTAGTRHVRALVVDDRGCADLADGYVYVAYDDGEPAGPVDVTVGASGVTSTGTVTVDLAATDCTGDVASGGALLVRADLGTPSGSSTGAGLGVTLDAAGTASLSWTFDSGHIGTATVYAGTESGGAIGTGTVSVTGDRALPEVVSVTPSGIWEADVDAVEIVFNEEMLSNNVTHFYIAVTGPSGTVDASYELSDDLTTVRVVPDDPFDAADGTYTLSLSQNLRDLAGNRLDGAWTDSPAPFSVTFGAVAVTLPDVTSCSQDVDTFVPDGDDASDSEADALAITPTATGSPEWWWLMLYDEDGERVRSLRQPGTDTEVTWNGRGDDGFVVPTGAYSGVLAPLDSYGNVGEGCDVAIRIEQHVDLP